MDRGSGLSYTESESIDDYLSHPAISASDLWLMRRTPAHFYHAGSGRPTRSQSIGTLTHAAILEPDLWEMHYIRGVEGDARTKAYKEAVAELQAQHPDKEVVRPADYDTVLGMRDSVEKYAPGYFGGEQAIERSIYWTDPATGLECKCRPDALDDDMHINLKTSRDASPRSFRNDARRYGYELAVGHYDNGINRPVEHVFLVVESSPPYAVAIYVCDPDLVSERARDAKRLLKEIHNAATAQSYPAFYGSFGLGL